MKMNAKKLIAAVAVFAAANSALAAEWVEFPSVPSTKTRAEVMAELKQARADGSYASLHQEYAGQYPTIGKDAPTRLAGEAGTANAK